jgi:hypothetical protein
MSDADDNFKGVNMEAEQQIDSTIIKLAEQYASLEKRAKELNEEKKHIREQADKIGISSLAWQIGVKTVKLMDKGERADFQRGYKRVITVLGERQRELWPEDADRIQKRKDAATAKAKVTGKEGAPDPDKNPRSDPASGGAGKKRGRPTNAEKAARAVAAQVSDRAEDTADRNKRVDDVRAESAGAEPGDMASPLDESDFPEPETDDKSVPETGDEMIARVSAEKMAELEQREGGQILDRAIDNMKTDANGLTGKTGLGSISDEVPLSQSQQAAEARAKAGI